MSRPLFLAVSAGFVALFAVATESVRADQVDNTSDGVFKPAAEYAKLIEPHLGVPPVVDLGAGVEIPIFVDGKKFTGDPGIHCCDNPSLQMGDCMSGSVVQRYEGRTAAGKPLPHVVWVSFGRHDGRGSLHNIDDAGMTHSVQMIGYNRETGATAFFESGDNRRWVRVDPKTNRLTGKLPGVDQPRAFNRAYSTPGKVQCVQCHQADPFIHNPFIDGAKLPNGETVVPKIADADAPYYVIGASNWDMRTIHIEGNACLDCHRIGMKTVEEFVGDGWNPDRHMPPRKPGSLREDFLELLAAWKNGPENTPDCEWIVPPAGDLKRNRVVKDDYPYKSKFNRPNQRVLDKLGKRPARIPEPTPGATKKQRRGVVKIDGTRWVSKGQTGWRFLDQEIPAKTWMQAEFDDAAWKEGRAPLGYGEDDVATKLSFGEDEGSKFPVAFFRLKFEIKEPGEAYAGLIRADDGAVIYLNGKEIHRLRVREGDIDYREYSSDVLPSSGAAERDLVYFPIDTKAIARGMNTLAISVHQSSGRSSDLVLDVEVVAVSKKVLGDLEKRDRENRARREREEHERRREEDGEDRRRRSKGE